MQFANIFIVKMVPKSDIYNCNRSCLDHLFSVLFDWGGDFSYTTHSGSASGDCLL